MILPRHAAPHNPLPPLPELILEENNGYLSRQGVGWQLASQPAVRESVPPPAGVGELKICSGTAPPTPNPRENLWIAARDGGGQPASQPADPMNPMNHFTSQPASQPASKLVL